MNRLFLGVLAAAVIAVSGATLATAAQPAPGPSPMMSESPMPGMSESPMPGGSGSPAPMGTQRP